ncbi:MAG: sigma-70 family RNA polymerase sigma factor [Candidatus Limnocylindrales bacterium]
MSEQTTPLPLRVATVADDADRAVLARIATGELHALDELYERYKTMAYSIAYRITNDATLAEDVVQDAFLGAWRNAERYITGRGSVKTWLLSIVHHRAIDAVRRRRPTTELPEREEVPPAQFQLPDVWSEVSAKLDAETVREALTVLSDVQREAIELAYFGGLTQQEVSERTGTPLGTVKSRMRLGLLAMRRVLLQADPAQGAGTHTTTGTSMSGQEADPS